MKLHGNPGHRTADTSSWSRRLALLVLVPAACSSDGSGQSEGGRDAVADHGSAAGAGSGANAGAGAAIGTRSVLTAVVPVPTAGLDSALLAQAVRDAAALPRLRTLLVSRHGELALERHFRGPALTTPANVKSVSKSILSAVAGIAIAEGHLSGVDQPIAPFFEQYLAPHDDAKRRITIGHLLTMQSGLERTSGSRYGSWVSSSNWVRYAVTRPLIAEPGGRRMYSTGNSHLLAAVLTQSTGQSLWTYAREKMAEPLGIRLPRWPADPQGIFFGGNEMRLTPRDLVRFGEMYRNGGRHEGQQIVPESWVRQSLTPRTGSRRPGEGYGYGWFLSQVGGYPMFYAWGYGGQFLFVVPALELTVVTTSDPDVAREGDHLRAVRRILSELIVPAAVTGHDGSARNG